MDVLQRGLPANTDAERFLLGSVLIDDSRLPRWRDRLQMTDFSLEKHRKIWAAICEVADSGDRVDRVTLANCLMSKGQLEAVDGLGYLVSLDEGMPTLSGDDSYESWLRIVVEKALRRRMVLLASRIQSSAYEDDLAEAAERGASDLLGISQSLPASGSDPVRAGERMAAIGLDAILATASRSGTKTGFSAFDEMTGGFHASELNILAARPAMGKTALALNMATAIARRGNPVLFLSLEMSAQSLLLRLLQSEARIGSTKIRSGDLSSSDRNLIAIAAARIDEMPLFIDDTSSISLGDVAQKLRRVQASGDGRMWTVFIDYLQLMRVEEAENRNLAIGAITRGLKLLAKDQSACMVALSQLSRGPEARADHRPQLSDLRESGSIEQDADNVFFLFREEVYKPDRTDLRGLADLMISKQRNGPTGVAQMVFLSNFTRFENRLESLE